MELQDPALDFAADFKQANGYRCDGVGLAIKPNRD
jgi:hypothetical protein